MYFFWSLQFASISSPPPVEPIIIEHMIRIATTPKTSIEYELFSFDSKLHIINTVESI